jgi:hypothetical protein
LLSHPPRGASKDFTVRSGSRFVYAFLQILRSPGGLLPGSSDTLGFTSYSFPPSAMAGLSPAEMQHAGRTNCAGGAISQRSLIALLRHNLTFPNRIGSAFSNKFALIRQLSKILCKFPPMKVRGNLQFAFSAFTASKFTGEIRLCA